MKRTFYNKNLFALMFLCISNMCFASQDNDDYSHNKLVSTSSTPFIKIAIEKEILDTFPNLNSFNTNGFNEECRNDLITNNFIELYKYFDKNNTPIFSVPYQHGPSDGCFHPDEKHIRDIDNRKRLYNFSNFIEKRDAKIKMINDQEESFKIQGIQFDQSTLSKIRGEGYFVNAISKDEKISAGRVFESDGIVVPCIWNNKTGDITYINEKIEYFNLDSSEVIEISQDGSSFLIQRFSRSETFFIAHIPQTDL